MTLLWMPLCLTGSESFGLASGGSLSTCSSGTIKEVGNFYNNIWGTLQGNSC